MWSKHFDRITFIKEREVAVNLISKHGLFGQVWRAFVFEYGQAVFQSRCQDCHLRERYRSLPALSYHVQFHAIEYMFLVEQYPFDVISVDTFRFFPLQVTIGMESTMDMRESQSLGLNDCIIVNTNTLNASESIFRRTQNV